MPKRVSSRPFVVERRSIDRVLPSGLTITRDQAARGMPPSLKVSAADIARIDRAAGDARAQAEALFATPDLARTNRRMTS